MSLVNPGALPYEPIETFPRWAEKSSLFASVLRWIAWSVCGIVALVFLWQPIGVGAQLGFATSVIVAMTLVRTFVRGPTMRWTFLALGSFVVLRYLYWRATQTLPDTDDLVDFTFGTLLAAAELYCAYVLAVSLVINADPVTRSDAPAVPDHDLPEIDVFIPSYDEDPEILAMTVAAARSMDYPAGKVTVWLLDDGGTDQKCADPDPVKARKAKSRRAALRTLCERARCELSHAAAQRARQGGQPQQRPRPFEGSDRRRVRRRPRAVQIVPARDHRTLLPRSEALPRADAARLPQPRSGRAQPADLRPHAVRERDVLRGDPARPRQVERIVLLRLGRGAAARGTRGNRRLLRAHRHRGLRNRVRAASRRLDQRLCRQAAHRWLAARDASSPSSASARAGARACSSSS